ncbi:hypothetical protein ACS0TY_024231 [Phlomoides rotata]
MNTVAEDVLVRCFNGAGISTTYDSQKDRKPYHRNCSCALHKSKDGKASPCFHLNCNNTLVMNKPWFKCSLSVETPNLLLFQRNKMDN